MTLKDSKGLDARFITIDLSLSSDTKSKATKPTPLIHAPKRTHKTMGNKPRRVDERVVTTNNNNNNNNNSTTYLSTAAASALGNMNDHHHHLDQQQQQHQQDSNNNNSDSVPSAIAASPDSSAPSSPKGSVIDGHEEGSLTRLNATHNSSSSATSSLGESESAAAAAAAAAWSSTTDSMHHPLPVSNDTNDNDLRNSSNVDHHDDDEEDPYANVRERMEALSMRDKLQYVHHAQPPSSSSSSSSKKEAVRSPHCDITIFAAITTYLGYIVLIVTGHVRDVCANLFRKGRYFRSNNATTSSTAASTTTNNNNNSNSKTNYPSDDFLHYAPLLKSWENFYTRRLYHRIQDCFNRPIASRPSAIISVLERVSFDGNKTMTVLGPISNLHDKLGMLGAKQSNGKLGFAAKNDEKKLKKLQQRAVEYQLGEHYREMEDGRVVRRCLNLGSYNYLGFADDWDITCKEGVMGSLLRGLPSSVGSSRLEFGTTKLHSEVERIVASFVGKEDAIVLNMGFNTNATIIPTLTTRGDLIVSDELNHTSIVNGARASGAAIRTFRHNDAGDLDLILREAIVYGQPRTRRPWNRILVIVEGIYSMEGEYCDLRNVVDVCKKYGAYVYLDEAHSIGAMGSTGRGCCEFTGVDPRDVDVLMGTFTKSFGGMGGYVAADRKVVDMLRRECAGSAYHNSISPVVCQQIISSFKVISGEDGTNIGKQKLNALRDNSNYFRMRLTDMGLHVLGHYDSPIMPVMLYNPTKIAAFSRECLKRGLAVVVVGFPAVPILMSRARFCISAGHTRQELDRALKELDEIADLLKLRYARSTFG